MQPREISCLPSVKRVDCEKVKEIFAQILYHTKEHLSQFCRHQERQMVGDPFYLKFLVKLTPLERKRRFSIDIRSQRLSRNTQRTSSSAITERPRCRVGQFSPKVEDWIGETIFCRHYRSISNHCDVIGHQSYRIREKMQNKGCYAVQGHSKLFMVTEDGINRMPVCDFLLVINTN